MIIEYRVSEYLWTRYGYTLARRRGEPYSRRRYYFLAVWPIVLLALGAFSAFSALSTGGSIIFLLIGFMLGVMIIKGLASLRSHERAIEETYFPRHLDRDGSVIRLEISDTGLREFQSEMVLSVGCGDIVSTNLEEDLLIISLKGLRKLVIPRSSFGFSDLDLERVRDEVDRLRASQGHEESTKNDDEQDADGDAEEAV